MNTTKNITKRHVSIRIGDTEFNELNKIATKYNVSVSDAMRWAVRAGLTQLDKKEIPEAIKTRR